MKNSRAFGNARGFTLIELVIVITIIGILAAVALPRLIDAQRDARVAKANAIYGSIRSAVALARSRCELDVAGTAPSATTTNCASVPPKVNMDGLMIDIVNRHPAATATGIESAAAIDLTADGLTAGGTGNTRTYDVAGGTIPNCRITYKEATLSGTAIVAPVISVVTSGC
ncbi:MAG: type II secretion system GspH family protein [Sulfuritalea sp.]|nr:type II secretion system GspH family protein [Sulfuritalea sp.]